MPTGRGNSVLVWSISTVSVATAVVVLRLYTRSRILNIIGREDWVILAALFFSIANTIGMCFQAEFALGQHVLDLSGDQIENFLKAFYFTVLSYNISQSLAKISILLLYLRIFSTTNIRRPCYILLTIVILFGIELFFTAILVCVPASRWWDSAHVAGKCIPDKPLWFTNVTINIATDVGIVLLPMPVIHTLILPRKQKLGLYFIFAIGSFVCIVSGLRLHWLIVASNSTDTTWDNVGIANWSCIELNTAIICPCLTTLKPLLSFCFPSIFPSASSPSKVYHQHSEGNDGSSSSSSKLRGVLATRDIDLEMDACSLGEYSHGGLEPVVIRPRRL